MEIKIYLISLIYCLVNSATFASEINNQSKYDITKPAIFLAIDNKSESYKSYSTDFLEILHFFEIYCKYKKNDTLFFIPSGEEDIKDRFKLGIDSMISKINSSYDIYDTIILIVFNESNGSFLSTSISKIKSNFSSPKINKLFIRVRKTKNIIHKINLENDREHLKKLDLDIYLSPLKFFECINLNKDQPEVDDKPTIYTMLFSQLKYGTINIGTQKISKDLTFDDYIKNKVNKFYEANYGVLCANKYPDKDLNIIDIDFHKRALEQYKKKDKQMGILNLAQTYNNIGISYEPNEASALFKNELNQKIKNCIKYIEISETIHKNNNCQIKELEKKIEIELKETSQQSQISKEALTTNKIYNECDITEDGSNRMIKKYKEYIQISEIMHKNNSCQIKDSEKEIEIALKEINQYLSSIKTFEFKEEKEKLIKIINKADSSRSTKRYAFKLLYAINSDLAILKNANLTEIDLSNMNLEEYDLSGTKLPKYLTNANLSKCQLPEDISEQIIEGANLSHTFLYKTKLPISLKKVNLQGAILPKDLSKHHLEDTNLSYTDLEAIKLPSQIMYTDLSYAKLPKDLSKNYIYKSNLSGIDLTNIKLPNTLLELNLSDCKLPESIMDKEITNTNLINAILPPGINKKQLIKKGAIFGKNIPKKKPNLTRLYFNANHGKYGGKTKEIFVDYITPALFLTTFVTACKALY